MYGQSAPLAYKYYPKIAPYENGIGINTNVIKNDGLNCSEQTETYINGTVDTATSLNVTQSYYTTGNIANSYTDPIYYTLFHCSGDEWIASRCINVGNYYHNNGCYFMIWTAGSTWLGGAPLSRNDYSSLWTNSSSYGIRPVIELSQGVKATYSTKYNNTYNTFTLSN